MALLIIVVFAFGKDAALLAAPPASELMIYNMPDYFGRYAAKCHQSFLWRRSYNDNGAGLAGAFNFSKYSSSIQGYTGSPLQILLRVPENARKITGIHLYTRRQKALYHLPAG